jgi:hypothetical protein
MRSQATPVQRVGNAEDSAASEVCSSPSAVLDLAALSEGNLSEDGLRRLAGHIRQCPTCAAVFASLHGESHRASSDHEVLTRPVANGNCCGPGVGRSDE